MAGSVNSGDSYVFLTETELFNWQGKFSNVIERARSAEVALTILQKKVSFVFIFFLFLLVLHEFFLFCSFLYSLLLSLSLSPPSSQRVSSSTGKFWNVIEHAGSTKIALTILLKKVMIASFF